MSLLEKMSTFVRVVEAGSFSAAAKQLRVSPAAVSRSISTLESQLRVSLISRTTRAMSITEAGRQYFERCQKILREVDEAQAIGSRKATTGSLLISAPVTFGLTRVVPLLPTLIAKHPELAIDLRLEDPMIDLAFQGVDLAIRVGGAAPDTTGVIAQSLPSFHRVVVASPKYLKRHGEPKTPQALSKHDALMPSAANEWTLLRENASVTVNVRPVFRSNSLLAIHQLAVDGVGLTLMPDWFARDRNLKHLLTDWRSQPVPVIALFRTEHRGSARVRAFVDHLRAGLAP